MQNTAKSCQIRTTANLPFKRPLHAGYTALVYEAFVGRVLQVARDHQLRGASLRLGERAQILCKALGLIGRHLAAGCPVGGRPLGRCGSLLPIGARHEVLQHLLHLADHCRAMGSAPQGPEPRLGDRFLLDYLRPLDGGQPLLRCSQCPPCGQASNVPLAAKQRRHPPGLARGTMGNCSMRRGGRDSPRTPLKGGKGALMLGAFWGCISVSWAVGFHLTHLTRGPLSWGYGLRIHSFWWALD